jgi:hypothetical protein
MPKTLMDAGEPPRGIFFLTLLTLVAGLTCRQQASVLRRRAVWVSMCLVCLHTPVCSQSHSHAHILSDAILLRLTNER